MAFVVRAARSDDKAALIAYLRSLSGTNSDR
jgi:hypothetical protein